jgi:hypothetical protein
VERKPALASKLGRNDRLDEETEKKWTIKKSDRQEKIDEKERDQAKRQETVPEATLEMGIRKFFGNPRPESITHFSLK